MKVKIVFVVAFFSLSLILTGCAYKSIQQGSIINKKRVEKTIIDGETTKQEVILEYGSPKKTMENEKMFFYEWSETSQSRAGFYGSSSTDTYQLVVLFDDAGIVKMHRIAQVAKESQSGMGDTKQPAQPSPPATK